MGTHAGCYNTEYVKQIGKIKTRKIQQNPNCDIEFIRLKRNTTQYNKQPTKQANNGQTTRREANRRKIKKNSNEK